MTVIRNLSRNNPGSQKAVLQDLADYADAAPVDSYGADVSDQLEKRLCVLLGKEACVAMPSGKAAQNTALKLWSDRSGSNRIAVHPRSHIEEAEGKAYGEVFGLQAVALGPNHAQPTLDDLLAIKEPLGVASVEIALRPLGGTLIPWDELTRLSEHCRAQSIPFHADAARIWETQTFYQKSLPEIAALFDSLYVSFYKVLGGLFGGALLGPEELVQEARIWQQRLGQTPYRQFPYVLAAMKGLDEELPRVPDYCQRAVALSNKIATLHGVFAVTPRPAQTNMFQVHVSAGPDELSVARDQVREMKALNLFDNAVATSIEGVSMFEVIIGPSAMEMTDEEIMSAFELLLEAVGAGRNPG